MWKITLLLAAAALSCVDGCVDKRGKRMPLFHDIPHIHKYHIASTDTIHILWIETNLSKALFDVLDDGGKRFVVLDHLLDAAAGVDGGRVVVTLE